MFNFQSLSVDAASTAVFLVKLENILRDLEEQKSPLHSFLLEFYQHELDMAAIRLAGPKSTKAQRLEAAELIKAAVSELKGGGVGFDCQSSD